MSYDNITVKGPLQADIAAFLNEHGCDAYVSPNIGDITAIYDNEGADIALALSAHFNCTTLFAYVFDGDYLFYKLCRQGNLLDAYCSHPELYVVYPDNPAKWVAPRLTAGNAAALCQAFDVPDASKGIDEVLKHRDPEEDLDLTLNEYWSGVDYQERLFVALRLPKFLHVSHWSYHSAAFFVPTWSEEDNNHFGFPTAATFIHTGR